MPIDDGFIDEDAKDEVKQRNRILRAQWFGGTVQFGKNGGRSVTFAGMKKIDPVIKLRWEEGEPEAGRGAVLEALIGGEEQSLFIEAEYQDMDRMVKRRLKEYKPLAEKWALWKWHTLRGTPVNEFDGYLTEPNFVAPTFQWEAPKEAPAEAPRRGRPPKAEAEAA